MDLFTLAKLVARRWYIFLLGIVASVGLTVHVAGDIEPEYRTTGSMLFLAPPIDEQAGTDSANPYLLQSGSLRTTSAVVAQVATSDPSRSEVANAGADAAYTVEISGDNTPVLIVSATGATPESARRTVQIVFDSIERELASLQEGSKVPADQQITSRVLISPDVTTVVEGDEKRSAAIVIGLGVVASATLAVAVESLADMRRRRRAEEPEMPDTPEESDDRQAPDGAHDSNGAREAPAAFDVVEEQPNFSNAWSSRS